MLRCSWQSRIVHLFLCLKVRPFVLTAGASPSFHIVRLSILTGVSIIKAQFLIDIVMLYYYFCMGRGFRASCPGARGVTMRSLFARRRRLLDKRDLTT